MKSIGDVIFGEVVHAMDNAEEMGGPEGSDYLRLMRRIEAEAHRRRVNAAESIRGNRRARRRSR